MASIKQAEGIYQRGKDERRLTLVYDVPTANGSRKQQTTTFVGTLTQAKKERSRLMHEAMSPDYVAPTTLTVGKVFEDWLKTYGEQRWEPKTFQTNELFVRRYICHPEFGIGRMPVSKLTGLALDRFYITLREQGRSKGTGVLSDRTVRQCHDVVTAGLKWAARKKLIRYNTALDADPPKRTKKADLRPDAEGIRRLMIAAEGTPLHLPILLAVWTGMRQGEICGLRWDAIDFDAGTLEVLVALQQVNKKTREAAVGGRMRDRLAEVKGVTREKLPKNGETRVVPIAPPLLVELRRVKAKQTEIRLALGLTDRQAWPVAAKEDGSQWTPNAIANGFRRFAADQQANLTFHQLRHQFASLLAEGGVHPMVAAELLGHHDIKMTYHYTHVGDKSKSDAVGQLVSILGPTTETGTDG